MPKPHARIPRRPSATHLLLLALLAAGSLQWASNVRAEVPRELDADGSTATGTQSVTAGILEVPPPGSNQSGIGVVTGWACDAERIVLRIDGIEREAAYGTRRADTATICGDTDNGFGYLINWNALGDGTHSIEAVADGVSIGRSQINVSTLGEPFRRGLSGTYDLLNFPSPGESTTVEWVESAQGFRIVPPRLPQASALRGLDAQSPAGVLENPQEGAPASGIGLISGWVCEAEQVLVYIDDAFSMSAAYGTSRSDTTAACGDSDNGFGALTNWNLLGDGPHHVRVEADGVVVGEAIVMVQTLGEPFVRGLSGRFGLGLFGGRQVELEWQEAQQNFVIDTFSPAPTPALTPVPTPTPTAGIEEPTPTPRPTLRPTPRPTPRATPTFTPSPRPTQRPTPRPTQRACCKVCTTGKACGDSCISRSNTCHVGGGCACNG